MARLGDLSGYLVKVAEIIRAGVQGSLVLVSSKPEGFHQRHLSNTLLYCSILSSRTSINRNIMHSKISPEQIQAVEAQLQGEAVLCRPGSEDYEKSAERWSDIGKQNPVCFFL